MAVDHDEHVPTEDLILSKPRRHFRTTVHAIHWQLRSLIGVSGKNVVYYVTGDQNKNIQRLNTTTLEAETIKRLPFSPRCLVAENGWICCGGEFGDFTAIQLQDGPSFNPYNVSIGFGDLDETDSPPPEDLIFLSLARARSAKNLMADSKKYGKELVNCITLWFPPTLSRPVVGAYAEPMAVLSNNDKTVTLIKLQSQDAEQVLTYPDCVNRAIISPDGRLMVAITDDPYLYMHERVEKSPSWGPFRSADKPMFEWKPCGRIHLRHQSPDAPTTVRGSFAACFSSNGKYLAVGTQSASISIFNVDALTVPSSNPLLTCFLASRPNAEHGAVRDMAFAPGCSDLLAWTEDRGRVGVVDLRNGYISRQTICLDTTDDFEHITITDRTTIDPRLLEQRGSEGLTSAFANSLDLSIDNATIRSETREALARYLSPLTREETSVLDAITEQRRRQQDREQRNQQGPMPPGTISPNSRPPWAERATRSGPTSNNAGSASHERSSSITRTVNEIMGGIRDQRERLRELRDAQERLRGPQRDDSTSGTERRRAAITPSGRTGGQARGDVNHLDRRSLRLAVDHIIGSTGAREVSDAPGYSSYGSGFDPSSFTTRNATNATSTTESASDSHNRLTGPIPIVRYANIDARRDRAAYLMREWDETRNRRIERFFARGEMMPTDPYDTSGMAWSDDGQILFVGADDGIFELHVNQQGRKLFSSVSMR